VSETFILRATKQASMARKKSTDVDIKTALIIGFMGSLFASLAVLYADRKGWLGTVAKVY
jgi:hypothetical protein